MRLHEKCESMTTRSLSSTRLLSSVALASLLLPVGCGGTDEFSQPSVDIQKRFGGGAAAAPANEQSESPDSAASDVASAPSEPAEGDETRTTEPAGDMASAESSSNPPVDTSSRESSGDSAAAPATASSAEEAAGSPPSDSEVMTASGRTEQDLTNERESNGDKTVAENAAGVLDALRMSSDQNKGRAASDETVVTADEQAWRILTRRLALQFFLASSSDGENLAASTGERSVSVASSLFSRKLSTTPPAPGSETITPGPMLIEGLPATLNSIALTDDGQHLLVGTVDGRLLVRSLTYEQDWDLFARDQYLLEEEYRTVARLSDQAIIALRMISPELLLSVDSAGTCCLWKLSGVAKPAPRLIDLTPDTFKNPGNQEFRPTPETTMALKAASVTGISVARSAGRIAVSLPNGELRIVSLQNPSNVRTITAAQCGKVRPVTACFSDSGQLYAGLADGRVIVVPENVPGSSSNSDSTTDTSAASPTSSPVPTSTADANGDLKLLSPGDPEKAAPAFTPVFTPDVQDPRSAITAMLLLPEKSILLMGNADGQIIRFSLSEKRPESIMRQHDGPVYHLQRIPNGVISHGLDRKVRIVDRDVAAPANESEEESELTLPVDPSLATTDSEETAATGQKTTGTRPVRKTATNAVAAKPTAGVRSADRLLGLLEHQLRLCQESERSARRTAILKHQGRDAAISPASASDKPVPVLCGTVTTHWKFQEQEWNPVGLRISDDGLTLVAGYSGGMDSADRLSGSKLVAWDVPTGTVLRSWQNPANISELTVDFRTGTIGVPGFDGLFQMAAGRIQRDVTFAVRTVGDSPGEATLFLGRSGLPGTAVDSVRRFDGRTGKTASGLTLFESDVTALRLQPSTSTLFVATRERDLARILELDAETLQVKAEVLREPLPGRSGDGKGTEVLVPSSGGRALVVQGTYQNGRELRLIRKSGERWLLDEAIVIRESQRMMDTIVNRQPAQFVANQESRVVLFTATDLCAVSLKKGRLEQSLPVPDVNGHRPVIRFSPDGQWAVVGDGEGKIWACLLSNLERKPLTWQVHSGPIAGLAFSSNGQFLVTAGEDNQIRCWNVQAFLTR